MAGVLTTGACGRSSRRRSGVSTVAVVDLSCAWRHPVVVLPDRRARAGAGDHA
jgi:hypothetical protein